MRELFAPEIQPLPLQHFGKRLAQSIAYFASPSNLGGATRPTATAVTHVLSIWKWTSSHRQVEALI